MESQILQITHRRERKLEAAILQNIYLLQLGHALKLFNVVVTNYAVNDGVYHVLNWELWVRRFREGFRGGGGGQGWSATVAATDLRERSWRWCQELEERKECETCTYTPYVWPSLYYTTRLYAKEIKNKKRGHRFRKREWYYVLNLLGDDEDQHAVCMSQQSKRKLSV